MACWIAKAHVGNYAFAKKCGGPVKCAVNELIGNHEVGRLVLFFQRTHSGDGEDPLDPELLQAQDVGAKVQLAGKNAMSPAMPRQKCYFASFQGAQNIGIRRAAKRSLEVEFVNIRKSGHGIQSTAPDNADFRLLQVKFS